MEKEQAIKGKKTQKYALKSQITNKKTTNLIVGSDLDIRVAEAIQNIIKKMNLAKIQTLHPPFFQKTLTKFRQQSYSHKLRKQILLNLGTAKHQSGVKLLNQFVFNFDYEYVDSYIQQIRQPYIRKIFQQGYQIDKVNFKKLNSEYQLRKQIQNVLNQTSEWLIQIQLTEDILNRIHLYFDIPFNSISQNLKKEGAQQRGNGWFTSFSSLVRKISTYTLRKSSKVIQNSFFAAITPAAALLTLAIIGGNASIPFKPTLDIKAIIAPIIAVTVPYVLDNMAESLQRNDFKQLLQNWAKQFEQISSNIRKFNTMLQQQIISCCQSVTQSQFMIHKTNLTKYMQSLGQNVSKVSKYNQEEFEQMRLRTQAYFKQYVQIKDGEWIKVFTPQQFQEHKKTIQKQ